MNLFQHILVAEGRLFIICDQSTVVLNQDTLTRVKKQLKDRFGVQSDPTWLAQIETFQSARVVHGTVYEARSTWVGEIVCIPLPHESHPQV